MKKVIKKKWLKPKIKEEEIENQRNLVATCVKNTGPLSDSCCGCLPPGSFNT